MNGFWLRIKNRDTNTEFKIAAGAATIRDESPIGETPRFIVTYRGRRYLIVDRTYDYIEVVPEKD